MEDITRCIAGMWENRLGPQPTAAWEIVLGKRKASFYMAVPSEWATLLRKQLATVWPKATIEAVGDPLDGMTFTHAARLELKHHYMFSLRTDRRTLGALPSLLEVTKLLTADQVAVAQVLMQPAPPDWYESAATAYEKFRAGKMPQRVQFTAKSILQNTAKVAAYAMLEVTGMIEELLTGEAPKPIDLNDTDKAKALRENPKNGALVAEKLRGDALEVTIRLATNAEPDILRAMWYAFRSLDGDNSYIMRKENAGRIHARRVIAKINHDYHSTLEASRLILMPPASLQDDFDLEAKKLRETELPAIVTSGGMRLGNVEYKGSTQPVYIPISNHDELCLPRVVVGGMGTGKTTFAINLAYEAQKNGFSAVVFDPADGKTGDELEKLLPGKIVRYRFGTDIIALDWRETRHGSRRANRMANELLAFFDGDEEAGVQTARYLRAAAKAANNLDEIGRIFTDDEFRKDKLETMSEYDQKIWSDYELCSSSRKMQIAAPILNRLDMILGDDYIRECIESTKNGIDFANLLDKKGQIVVIDMPESVLTAPIVNLIGGILNSKLDIAMMLRKSRHPVFIIQDEPHQYLKGARTWKTVAVESRKWRFSYCWLFHEFTQLPKDVRQIIQAAGAHYHIYRSGKSTYRELAEELAPFTVDELIKTPRHYAVNVIHAGGETIKPFLAKMARPKMSP